MAYAKVFQLGKVPKTVHLGTARRFNAAGAILRKSSFVLNSIDALRWRSGVGV